MTSEEWNLSIDIFSMIDFLNDLNRADYRRTRLFSCACCRMIWNKLDTLSKNAVEIAEKFADGEVSDSLRRLTMESLPNPGRPGWYKNAEIVVNTLYPNGFSQWGVISVLLGYEPVGVGGQGVEDICSPLLSYNIQADILRDIFSTNPAYLLTEFSINRDYLSTSVVSIAKEFYSTRDNKLLGILGDALQDSSYTDSLVLDHCYSSKPHARGCWVIDAIIRG